MALVRSGDERLLSPLSLFYTSVQTSMYMYHGSMVALNMQSSISRCNMYADAPTPYGGLGPFVPIQVLQYLTKYYCR